MTPRYVITPGAPFPKRWKTADGDRLRVMCEPVEGYVMARFHGCAPFILSVKEILNATRQHHKFGPFECLDAPGCDGRRGE